MDDKINIVKSPAPVIYTPQEVACIFKEQLKTPAKVVTIEGVYRQNPKSGNYYGYFYDSLAAQNSNFEMTLVVPAALREKMKDGTLVQVSGVVSKELRNRCSIDLQFNVTRYDVIEENVISEDEQRLMSLQAEKSARGYRNVDGVLEALPRRKTQHLPAVCKRNHHRPGLQEGTGSGKIAHRLRRGE